MRNTRRLLLVSLAVSCVYLVGCARSQVTRYYTIAPLDANATDRTRPTDLTIGVGPVTLPDYVDRSQMADIVGQNEVRFAEFHRWAEPLGVMLVRVLKENLAVLLGTQRVIAYPWPSSARPDVAVEVEVLRFGRLPTGRILLDARWRLRTPKAAGVLRRTTIEVPAQGGDYAAFAGACSKAVANLSREIADAIAAQIR
jgi:uncharacterized lipoprotein YmbA